MLRKGDGLVTRITAPHDYALPFVVPIAPKVPLESDLGFLLQRSVQVKDSIHQSTNVPHTPRALNKEIKQHVVICLNIN